MTLIAVLAFIPLAAVGSVLLAIRADLDRSVGTPRKAPVAAAPVAPDGGLAAPGVDEGSGLYLRVHRGASLPAVTARLQSIGWIDRSWTVTFEARRRGWDRRLKPGWYRYLAGETVRDLMGRLTRGECEQTWFTIPEGWRAERILTALADSAWIRPEALHAAASDAAWLAAQSVPGPGIEGYIFPDTYRLPKGDDARLVLADLLRPGLGFWEDSLRTRAEVLGLDRRATWALASIVEAEAASPAERRRIAAVFLNRLRRGMKLESDPTVLYALGRPPGRVFLTDLQTESPYNTYRHAGLPPGPICSPGRASLRAAVDPEPGCTALFFVARGDGTHVFSQTLAEHDSARLRARAANDRPRRAR